MYIYIYIYRDRHAYFCVEIGTYVNLHVHTFIHFRASPFADSGYLAGRDSEAEAEKLLGLHSVAFGGLGELILQGR